MKSASPQVGNAILKLHSEACDYQLDALAYQTKCTCLLHVRKFVTFCTYFHFDAREPIELTVCLYTAMLDRTVQVSTVSDYLKGLKDFTSCATSQGLQTLCAGTNCTDIGRASRAGTKPAATRSSR